MNTLRVDVPLDKGEAEVALNSLDLEVRKQDWHRSNTELSYGNGYLTLQITSKDPTALRAAANTNLRLLMLCLKLI
ncbi:MAG: hypothetical protein GF334_04385 [Candidatus Altiarchaeales archaeon]|nr:hypothetical protein [Candidatus Altiarchaeales archaeon]